jgi:hypothetical protein
LVVGNTYGIEEDLAKMKPMPTQKVPDFSLVLGGPLFHLYLRTHLSLDGLELVRRRVLVITLFAWFPLLFLSVIDGHALGGPIKIPFLYDVEAQVRFLIALPSFILLEVIVHRRISPVVRGFVERHIVVTEDLPRFKEGVNSALRARNSVVLEVALLVFVYTLGLWTWRSQIASGVATWYAAPRGTRLHLTLAGYWHAFVSIPIFQFMLLRWYMRLVVWFRLLWQVSRLNLHLTAAHPDRAGGLGFLGKSSYAFGPLLFAQGAMLSALIANRILYEGRTLLSFELEAAGFLGLFTLCILGPLVVFSPLLERTKQKGLTEYGLLANRYVFGFEEKWIERGAEETSELLGAADIQSLADLANSYSVVREMRIVPFGLGDIAWLAAVTAAPLLPLTLTLFSGEELLTRLIKVIFGF